MMPHMVLASLIGFLPLLLDPALDIALLAGADRERARRHVLANRGPRADVCPFANRDRRDELRVAADERPFFDRRLVLLHAVVVAGNGSCADVDLRPDRGISKV